MTRCSANAAAAGAFPTGRRFTVELRFYEELNEFLPRDREKCAFEVEIREPRSVKDLIESLGVPHTEIDLILVDGESARPFSRCAACNGLLQPISREEARSKVPPRTYGYAEQFLQCDSCGKVFWKGTHWQRLNQLVARALERDPKDHIP